ncbi:MAG: FkbM family methyltransferase [Verrucomicrobiae bacterium]|nr:FkbM family methyltransferase [Verrucomicrobiae bacterium]
MEAWVVAAEDGSAWGHIAKVYEMNRRMQASLLRLYRLACLTGFPSTGAGRAFSEFCYDKYKAWMEAGDVDYLASLVASGATIIDVGANIGFFTMRFAGWVSGGGRVLAIEPETTNFQRLRHMVHRRGLRSIVEPIQGAANDENGKVRLHVDPFHPGGHRMDDAGVLVDAYTLDHLLVQRPHAVVSLVKIDVQGAEERVLKGMRDTLWRHHPALFIEIDPPALATMGSSVDRIVHFLAEFGYRVHRLAKGTRSPALSRDQMDDYLRKGYADFLFLALIESGARRCRNSKARFTG